MKKSSRILALLLCAVMLVSTLSGCAGSGSSTSPAASGSAAATTSKTADGGVKLNLTINEELNTLDPAMNASMWSMQMITLTNQGCLVW